MANIFITGSADGLGQLAATELIKEGHQVVLHGRDAERARYAREKVPGATEVLIGDLSSMDETITLAAKANEFGKFDAVIHNAGVYRITNKSVSDNGLPLLFAVNTIAPYILTCLIKKPERLIYMSSGMHLSGDAGLRGVASLAKGEASQVSYSDTKLHDVILAMAVARKWPGVYSNAVNPGWVPTKMGGAGAPDDLDKGYETQVWLAVSDDPGAKISGRYLHHKEESRCQEAAKDIDTQERLIAFCEKLTGVKL